MSREPESRPREDEAPSWGERGKMRLLDHDLLRVDGRVKLAGTAKYGHDVRLSGMVWGRLVCCPVPRAKVEVDVAPALALAGCVAAYPIGEGTVSYLGQPVAAVAAETPELAEDAARAVLLAIEELPWAVDAAQAKAEGAPALRRDGNLRQISEQGAREATEEALAACDALVEATYTLPVQHHVCLETHGVVVDYRGGEEATVWASTQHTFGPLEAAARALGLPASKVRVLVEFMGGGFGSKFGLDVPGLHACQLAKLLGRPVHLFVDRPQEFLCTGNRSGSVQRLRGGATSDGRFVALASEMEAYGGLGDGDGTLQPYIYEPERSWTRLSAVHTHTDASRAMRAPGHPQASFAIESMIDELAYAIGMDPLEFRLRNLDSPTYTRQLLRVAEEIGWEQHPHKEAPGKGEGWSAVGIGFGVSTWGAGGRAVCEVDVRIARDGSVTASVGSQDLGTGTKTYVAAITAEELGLPLDAVEARIGDSSFGNANGSGGSTTVPSLAPAVKHAAWLARKAFAQHLGEVLGLDPGALAFEGGRVLERGGSRALDWKSACGMLPAEGLLRRGTWQADLAGRGVHGAQAAKVEVDLLTGRVQVLKMVCIQDVGLPLNTLALRSQINGGMIGALSYALLEERVIDPDLGLCLSANLEDYRIAGALEIPELVAIVDEEDERQQAIGVGEPPAIPGAGAIANAVHNACGLRIRELPITPAKVLDAIARRARSERS